MKKTNLKFKSHKDLNKKQIKKIQSPDALVSCISQVVSVIFVTILNTEYSNESILLTQPTLVFVICQEKRHIAVH